MSAIDWIGYVVTVALILLLIGMLREVGQDEENDP